MMKLLRFLAHIAIPVQFFAITTGAYSLENNNNGNQLAATHQDAPVHGTVMDWRLWEFELTPSDVQILPNGYHNFFLLEYWNPGITLSNPDNGGFSLMESPAISIHGESVEWNRYRVNSMDISNPADPGRPLVYIPISLWNRFKVLSPLHSYTNDAGFNWEILPPASTGRLLVAGGTGFVGGETWVPPETMDREPAQAWGAMSERRSMEPSGDVAFGAGYRGISGQPGFVFFEGIHHRRSFPLLSGYETGNRSTLYLSQAVYPGYGVSGFFQHVDRDHLGIETGNLDKFTLNGQSNSAVVFLTPLTSENRKFTYAFSAGYQGSRYEPNSQTPVVLDLVDEIVYGKIPEPKDSKTWFVGNHLDFRDIARVWIFDLSLFSRIRVEGVHEQNLYKDSMLAHTFNGVPYDVTVFHTNEAYSHYLTRLNPEVLLEKNWGELRLDIRAGLLLENGFSATEALLTRFDPTASIKLSSRPGSRWEIFTGFQHDAIPVSSNELAFLNTGTPSGGRYAWTDTNGDGIPQASEAGAIYNVTGGQYHTLSGEIKYPTRDEIYFGILHNFSEAWHSMLSVHGKLFSNMYLVNFDPAMGDTGYYEIERPDIRGGVLYNRDPAFMGNELYMLGNTGEDAWYASLELQVAKKNKPGDPWFMQVSAGGYYAQALTIPGNGPDYNDMGQIAESSADPNKQINTLAIPDNERGYIISILLGFTVDRFSFASSLRYRDGQPFGYLTIAQGLTQGPTIIQELERSRPPNGMPRYTFALTWDVRLRYILPDNGTRTSISLDVFNLLDSRTELYEYTLADERYRDPIETVTGRTIRLMMHTTW